MAEIKIAFVGDIMCGESFYNMGCGVATSLDKYGGDFLPADIVSFLRGHDVVFGNIECVLSDVRRNKYILRDIQMHGRAAAVGYLANWGLTVANVANNHILEHGPDAAVDTVRNLHRAGIKTIGAGKNNLFQKGVSLENIDIGNHRLALVGICLREEKYAFNGGTELDEAMRLVEDAANKGLVVIVSVHWGDEYVDRPSLTQVQIAKGLIDAGAEVVVGHHPHVLQGFGTCGDGFVAYSLGNFIFDGFLAESRWSVILSMKFDGARVQQVDYLVIESDNEHRPRIVSGQRKMQLDTEIRRRCGLLQTADSTDDYQRKYDKLCSAQQIKARFKLYKHLCRNGFGVNPVYWPQVLLRPIQRRLDLW